MTIKIRKVRWAEHVACMRAMGILVGKSEEKKLFWKGTQHRP
jgi:hypothetical protein